MIHYVNRVFWCEDMNCLRGGGGGGWRVHCLVLDVVVGDMELR